MAGSLSDYAENKALDHILGTSSWTMPTGVVIGLFTSDPGEASGGTEVSGGSYARTTITFNAASGGTATNNLVTFPTATANWGTVSHWVIFDGNGNRLFHGSFDTAKSVPSGSTVKILAGSLTISLD
jgi:hypothetical protein